MPLVKAACMPKVFYLCRSFIFGVSRRVSSLADRLWSNLSATQQLWVGFALFCSFVFGVYVFWEHTGAVSKLLTLGFSLMSAGIWHTFLVPRRFGHIESSSDQEEAWVTKYMFIPSDVLGVVLLFVGGLFAMCGLIFAATGSGHHLSLLILASCVSIPFLLIACVASGSLNTGGCCYRMLYPGDNSPPEPELDPFPSRYANSRFKPSRGRLGEGFYGGRPVSTDSSSTSPESSASV